MGPSLRTIALHILVGAGIVTAACVPQEMPASATATAGATPVVTSAGPGPTATTATEPVREVQLTEADNGKTVSIPEGGTIIIALASNPTTGFRWAVVSPLPSQLRQEGEVRFVPPGSTQPVVGAPGTEVFTFAAVGRGRAELRLEYKRSFESVPAARTFQVTVQVE